MEAWGYLIVTSLDLDRLAEEIQTKLKVSHFIRLLDLQAPGPAPARTISFMLDKSNILNAQWYLMRLIANVFRCVSVINPHGQRAHRKVPPGPGLSPPIAISMLINKRSTEWRDS